MCLYLCLPRYIYIYISLSLSLSILCMLYLAEDLPCSDLLAPELTTESTEHWFMIVRSRIQKSISLDAGNVQALWLGHMFDAAVGRGARHVHHGKLGDSL